MRSVVEVQMGATTVKYPAEAKEPQFLSACGPRLEPFENTASAGCGHLQKLSKNLASDLLPRACPAQMRFDA
jgi:hypothetical protein